MKRKNKSIFKKLIASYLIFTFVAIVGIAVFLLIALIQTLNARNAGAAYPFLTFNDDGSIKEYNTILQIDGWVEELDDDNQVINVIGQKNNDKVEYDTEELLQAVARSMNDLDAQMNNSLPNKYDYYCFYHEEGNHRYLFYYPTNSFKMIYSVNADELFYTSFDKSILVGVIIFLLLEILGVSLFISKRITNPLNTLSTGMNKIAKGEANITIPIYNDKEFIGIQTAFQNMASELEKQKQEKEELIKQRHQLLLELSHDIKTPVATIKSYALALSNHMVPEEETEKYYNTIARKADRVNQLTVDMFTFLKMESDDYTVTKIKFNFSEMIRNIFVEYYDEIIEAGFELEMNFGDKDYYVDGDEKLLTRVVENLVLNAKKYNSTGNSIEASLSEIENGRKLRLRIMDDGREIEKNIQKSMFEAFVRGEKDRNSTGGTGLGLAIAKKIIDKHDGQMEYVYFDSKNCFEIILDNCE